MRLKTRVLIIVLASLFGLVVMGIFGLLTTKQAMMVERQAQITLLLDFADAQLRYYHSQEVAGRYSREEAQARAKEALSAQRKGSDYFIVRSIADNVLLVHATTSRVGKVDPGGKALDGRPVMEAYMDAIAKSGTGQGFVELGAARPNSGDKTLYKKLSGADKFDPWNWIVVIGFFVDDIEDRFWQQATLYLGVGGVLLALLSALIFRMRSVILGQLGGEPQEAQESMKKIANGDLGIEIELAKDDNTSLMASLKLMQMKLKNMTGSIQENAGTLADQVKTFDDSARVYAETKSEEEFAALMRTVKKLGKTADILGKSVSRFRL